LNIWKEFGIAFLGAQTLIKRCVIALVTYHLSTVWPCTAHGMERLMCKTHPCFNRFEENKESLVVVPLLTYFTLAIALAFCCLL